MDSPNPNGTFALRQAFRAWWRSTPYRKFAACCVFGPLFLWGGAYFAFWIVVSNHSAMTPSPVTGEVYPVKVGLPHSIHELFTTKGYARIGAIIK
jgi:hypothetical protein